MGLLRTLGVEYIPRLAANFLKENAGLNIQFTFHTGVTQTLLDGLAAKKYDLVFCSQPPANLDFTAISVQKQDLVLITPRSHPLSSRHTIECFRILGQNRILPMKQKKIRSLQDWSLRDLGSQLFHIWTYF